MSKIGKLPIPIPNGVKVELDDCLVTVTGPKGTLSEKIVSDMIIKIEAEQITVERPTDNRFHRSYHGLTRTLIANMVTGVTEEFKKTLEIIGVGYRAEMKGKILVMQLGFSHPVLVSPPDNVNIEVIPKENKVIVTGVSKQLVGQTAAEIRRFRPPEPYKGKGVRYEGEIVRRKAGKAAASAA